jgi:hypothetical protein
MSNDISCGAAGEKHPAPGAQKMAKRTMTLKSTLAGTLFTLVTLVTLVALASSPIGCGGGDECQIAAAHIVDCVNDVGSPVSSSPAATAKCDGETACVAACINQTECDALKDAYGLATTAGATAFFACTRACTPN